MIEHHAVGSILVTMVFDAAGTGLVCRVLEYRQERQTLVPLSADDIIRRAKLALIGHFEMDTYEG